MRARADIRARPVSLILVTILVGLIGAIGITAFAGARRTGSAYARYRLASSEPEAFVQGCSRGFPWSPVDIAPISKLPQVAEAANGSLITGYAYDAAGRPLVAPPLAYGSLFGVSLTAASAATFKPMVLEGRLPVRPDEVAIDYGNTGLRSPGVGERISMHFVPQSQLDAHHQPTPRRADIVVPLTVVGRILGPGDLTGTNGGFLLGPDFTSTHPDVGHCDVAFFRLHGGLTTIPSFSAAEIKLAPTTVMTVLSNEELFVERTTRLQSIVLNVVALLAAFAGIMVLGQTLVRRTSLAALDTPILRALGMRRSEVVWAAVIPAAVVALGGSLIAIAVAAPASALFPVGVLRVAEPTPGIRVDPFAMAVGVAVIALTTLLSVAIPARWMASARSGVDGAVEYRGAERHSRLAAWIARLPLPPSAGSGARLALEPGHGRSATPVRSTLVGLVVAIVAMVASFGFSASMQHFGSNGPLSGSTYDFGGGDPFHGSFYQEQVIPKLLKDPGVRDLEVGNFQESLTLTTSRGSSLEAAWAFERLKGSAVRTTMLEGRWPRTSNEIALGRESLALLGAKVGDSITVAGPAATRDLTIVGVPVFPDIGFGPGLGRGAAITMDGLRSFYPDVTQNLALGRVVPGTDPSRVIDRTNAQSGSLAIADPATIEKVFGGTIATTLRSGSLPLKLSLLFALAAFATLVHLLLTSVRRRRRDLAILQTLGFTRGQIMATVAWQALVLTGLALLIGIPIGVLAGRLAWSAFAYRLGVVPEPVVSPYILLLIPVALTVALAVAVGPGLVARSTRPAVVLKAE